MSKGVSEKAQQVGVCCQAWKLELDPRLHGERRALAPGQYAVVGIIQCGRCLERKVQHVSSDPSASSDFHVTTQKHCKVTDRGHLTSVEVTQGKVLATQLDSSTVTHLFKIRKTLAV